MPGPLALLNIVVTANTAAANANLAKTEAQMKAVAATADKSALATAGAWQKTGQRMSSVGKTMTRSISLPAAAAGAVAVKMAMDFEHSMSLIQTQAGGSAAEVKNLTKQVEEFAASGRSTHGPKQLADALYHIESSGYRGAKAMEVLKASEALATTGAADMEQTTNALVGAMRSGIKGTQNLTQTVGSLNAIVGAGNMRMDDLTAAMGTGFLSNARQMGLTLNQAGAALAALTRQGQPATQGATRLSMAFRMLMAPTDKAVAALKTLHLTAGQLGTMMQAGKFPQAIHLLVQRLDALGNSPEALQKKATIIREMFGARSATGINTILQGLHQYDSTLTQVNQKSSDFNKLHGAAMQTPANRLRAIWAQLQVTLIKLGETLLPTVVRLAKVVESLASAFNSMPGFARDLLLGAIVLGPMIRMVGLVIQLAAAWKAVAAAQAGATVAGAAGGGAAAGGIAGLGAAGGLAAIAGIGAYMAASTARSRGELGGKMATEQAKLNQKLFEQLIAQAKASESGFTDFKKAQVAQRIMQYQREGKVSEEWASRTIGSFGTVRDQVLFLSQQILAKGPGPLQKYGQKVVDIIDRIASHAKKLPDALGPSLTQRVASSFQLIHDIFKNNLNKIAGITQKDMLFIAMHMQQGPERGRQALKVVFDKAVQNIDAAMQKGKISVEKGTAQIQKILQMEMQLLGIPFQGETVPLGQAHGRAGGFSKKQRGGFLPGPSQGDKIPLLAEGGEFMVNAKATKRFLPYLEAMNNAVPRFQKGGQLAGLGWQSNYGPGVVDNIAARALNIEADAARQFLAKMKKRYGAGNVQALLREAKRMDARNAPYVWGGGHSGFSRNGPWDCSGAISQLLHGAGVPISAPMVSGAFMSYGLPGAGDATIFANPSHVFASIGGKGYGTSAENPGGGFGALSYNSRPGFAQRHPSLAHVSKKIGQPLAKGFQKGGIIPSGSWNRDQLTTLAKYVGMKSPALMAAIAMAESSGNPRARGGAGEYGLWQIMPFWGGGSSLLDPIKNARKAKYILGKQGLTAWTMYKNRGYRRFLGGQVKPGLLAALRGQTTKTPKAGKPGKTPKGPRELSESEQANADLLQNIIGAYETRRSSMIDLISSGNMEALQRYQTAAAQNPLLGLSTPNMPTLASTNLPSAMDAYLYSLGFGYNPAGNPYPARPSNTLTYKGQQIPTGLETLQSFKGDPLTGGLTTHVHNHIHVDGKEIAHVVNKVNRRTSRRGNRPLPGARGR